jgi:hypothetical protein
MSEISQQTTSNSEITKWSSEILLQPQRQVEALPRELNEQRTADEQLKCTAEQQKNSDIFELAKLTADLSAIQQEHQTTVVHQIAGRYQIANSPKKSDTRKIWP